jgi:hypothetical protein
MQSLITRILPITLILLSLTIGCGPDSEFKNPCVGSWISRCAANTEILIIGPYRTECPSFSGNDCYLEFNEEAQRWHFFYDGIKGFDYEPGFIWTLEVSLHEYSTEWADASSHEYRLVEVLSKEAASVDERPPRIP